MRKENLGINLFIVLLFASIVAVGLNISRVAAQPVVDGTITPGEYAGGMAVTLVGPYPAAAPFPPQTVDAYIEWDSQYLYVAVNEPVPTLGGGTNDWIEFCFDAGPHRSFLDAFVLFGSGQLQYVKCPKPPGSWGWDTWPHTWWAVTGTATEFKFDYTDFGITFGDTIKMVIDRGRDAGSYPPLGDCVTWPFTANFYPPQGIDPTTWGDVGLNGAPPPPPPTHVVNGIIGSGEYDGGMTVQLVGKTDSTWTVDAYIDWDTEYLYVAVNEPVPPGGGASWIEFALDAGPSRSYLDAFTLFGSGSFHHTQCPKPPGMWSVVAYSFLAASATVTEFRIKYTDFGISLGDTIKMSIDRNQGPPPPTPYGFAAFWPQNALVYQPFGIDPTTWGDVTLSVHYTLTVNIVGSGSVTKSPDQTTYTHGTVVQLTATADLGWIFSSWSGDLTGSTNPDSVTMDGDKTVTATFTQDTVSLTVVSAYDSPNPSGTTSYTPGTSVTASVTSPVAGPTGYRYVCTGWTGTGDVPSSGTGTTVTFTINQDSGITWNWKTQTYLTVKTDPLGIATIPGEGWYDKSTTVTLTAPPVSRYVFLYWDFNGIPQGSGVNPVTVQVDCTATAHYTQVECEVTFYTDPACSDFNITFLDTTYHNDITDTFDSCTSAEATANIPEGYEFDHWEVTGNVEVSDPNVNPTCVTIDCGGTLKAVFSQIECQVTFLTDPVCSYYHINFQCHNYHNDTTDTFAYGTSGDAVAYCLEGWEFDHWEVTDNIEVSDPNANPTTVTIKCGGTLKAVFKLVECEVTFYTDPACSEYFINFECHNYRNDTTDIFPYGTIGNATAYSPPGWVFDHWEVTGNVKILCSATQNPVSIIIDCGGTLKAVFCPTTIPPDADFTWCPTTPKVNEVITFDASTSIPNGGTIVSYKWDFGDSNITTVTDPIIIHVYDSAATYNVILNVTDNEGKWDTETKTVKVVESPTACFTAVHHSLEVTFNASSSQDSDGYIVSYMWDFGDGNVTTVEDPVVNHTYAASGIYNVTLTVTDNDFLSQSSKNDLALRTLAADVNFDGAVNITDIAIAARAFGTKLGDEDWNEIADMDNNSVINIVDLATIALDFGKTV